MPWNADHSSYTDDAGKTYTADQIAELQRTQPGMGWGAENDAAGSGAFFSDPNSAWTRDWNNLGASLGYRAQQVDPTAPGGQLDTANADEDANKLTPLLNSLQQQAATGGGAWEGSLKDATQKASSTAQALGQSMPGTGYAAALRNIGNAQGATNQRAAGQANILRAQSKTGAQDQLTGLLGSMGDSAASQAASGAAAQQGITELNNTLSTNANKQITKDSESMGGIAAGAGMSKGGEVPGTPKVFGDDSRNDTVPAMLSPDEVVIPVSHADTPEHAADFVRALRRQKPQHMADGGTAGNGVHVKPATDSDTAAGVVSLLAPHVGAAMRGTGVKQEAPSIQNGGLLDTATYDANRQATLGNSNFLQGRANGAGPSVAGQQFQNANDDNIATAMQAGNRVSGGDVLQRTTQATQGSAGNSAATRANEQQSGQVQLAHALQAQRARDQSMAVAQQQAAFRQTQMNAGIGLEQQQALRGLLAGAGQVGAAYASGAGRRDSSFDGNDANANQPFDSGLASDEFSNPYGSGSSGPADLHDSNDLAMGGQVDSRGADFVAALKRAGIR